MNFAEAALLIQGSTCVYSKKVSSLMWYVRVTCSVEHLQDVHVIEYTERLCSSSGKSGQGYG